MSCGIVPSSFIRRIFPTSESLSCGTIDAKICYDPSIEPGGILIYHGEKLSLDDNLVMSTLRGSNLFSIDLEQPKSQKSILSGIGRIRDVAQGPDGYLYVITSNTDGKGFPTSSDDKLMRIVK